MVEEKSNTLRNLYDVFDLTNLVKQPTCFANGCNPILVDVILTNKPNFCANICDFDCGVSDIHNVVAVQFKAEIPPRGKAKKTYRRISIMKILLKIQ